MRNIILVGSGNVSTQLGIALKSQHYNIVQVYSRSIKNASKLARRLNTDFTDDISFLKKAELIIVSVNDDAILHLIQKLKNTAIVHTSGSIDISIFESKFSNFGVFYPLGTFNKEIDSDMSEVPLCIEANSLRFEKKLTLIANNISSNVVMMSSEQRRKLHIAAVFACNFSNHMFSIADEILSNSNIDFKILLPLINNTIYKIQKNKPKSVQTGPAKRKDMLIIDKHISLIKQNEIKELYSKISDNIIKSHE